MKKRPASGAAPNVVQRHSPAKRERASPRKHDLSAATIDRILDGARRVLIEHGYAELTTRRVAAVVGIAGGNLAYHFPSKRQLLRALIAKLLADYSRRFEVFFANANAPLGEEFEALIRWVLTDSIVVETVHTFRELWTLALHDPVIKGAVDDFYDEAMEGVVQILQQARPRANIQTTRELVQLSTIVSEGMTVLYGTRRDRAVPPERIIELMTSLIAVIAPGLQPTNGAVNYPSDARRGGTPRARHTSRAPSTSND